MKRKSRSAYEILLTTIKEKVQDILNRQLQLPCIFSDFEAMVINVVMDIFRGCRVAGCLFHLGHEYEEEFKPRA